MKTKQPLLKQLKSLLLAALLLGAFTQVGYGQDGREHTLVVCSSGLVKAFGYNNSCQVGTGSNIPDDQFTPHTISSSWIDEAVSVATGDRHSLALLDDGTVKAWGDNTAGASSVNPSGNPYVCQPVSVTLPGCAVAVAAGSSFSLALLADGTIYGWGLNNNGQLGNTTTTNSHIPSPVSGISNAIAIAAGGSHAMALLDDGTVKVWGNGSEGQLGDGTNALINHTPGFINVPTGMSDIVAIDAGGWHCVVLTDDNKVYAWGANNSGQLGVGSSNLTEDEPQFSSVFSQSTEIDIAAGKDFTIVLRSNGTTRVAGSNERRQLGLSSPTSVPWPSTPITGPTISNAIDIVAPSSARHAWAITSTGGVLTWGDNNYGACGFVSASARVDTPTSISLGCTAIPSETNHPQPCCVSILEDNRTEIGNGTIITSNVTYTGNYALQDVLTLNSGSITFNAADVICEPGSKIIVNGGWLIINNASHLYACSDMWEGIEVKNGAIVMFHQNSIIEDAITALDVEYGVAYLIEDAVFNKNRTHFIKTMPSSGTPTWTNDYRIKRCQFRCHTTPIGGTETNLLAPYATDRTVYAIVGFGASKLLVGSSSASDANTIDNCEYGIFNWTVDRVEVLHNDLEDIGNTGVYAAYGAGNGGETIEINYNEFDRMPYPIFCYDNDTTVRAHITYNTIDFDGMVGPPDYMTGITVQETTPASVVGTFNYWDVSHNTISNAPCGIHVRNMLGNRLSPAANLYVGDNVITHKKNGSNWQAAITSENVTEVAIANNTISHPTGAKHWWETGIRISGSSHNSVVCNYISDHGRPIMTFNDLRPSTDFVKNEMTDYEVGFHMKDSKIGHQVDATTGKPNDNQWISPWGYDYHIWCEGTGSVGNLSQFTVRNTGSTYYPTNRYFSGGGSPVPTPTTTSLTGPTDCAYTGPAFKTDGSEAVTLSPLADELSIMEETEGSLTQIEQATNWNARFNLYTALQRDSELLYAEEEALQTFAAEQQQGNIGILHRAMADVNGNVAENAGTLAALQSLEPTNRPEQTLKQVLQVLLAQEELMNEENEAMLRKVAQGCPIDDGFGVYIARAALLKIDTLPIPYSSDCERVSSLEEMAHKQQSDEVLKFHIYPNPAEGLINVSYHLEEGQEGLISVYTSTGGLVYSGRLEIGLTKTQIALNGVSSGLYLVTLDVNGNRKHSQRISVLR